MARYQEKEPALPPPRAVDSGHSESGGSPEEALHRTRMNVMRQRRAGSNGPASDPAKVLRKAPEGDAGGDDKAAEPSAADRAASALDRLAGLLPRLAMPEEMPPAAARGVATSVDATMRAQESQIEALLVTARRDADGDADATTRVEQLTTQLAEVRAAREARLRDVEREADEAAAAANAEGLGEAGHAGDEAEFGEAGEDESEAPESESGTPTASTATTIDGEAGTNARGAIESGKASATRQAEAADGSATTMAGSLEVKAGSVDATGSFSSKASAEGLDEGVGASTTGTMGAGYADGSLHASAGIEQEQTFSDTQTDKQGATVSAGAGSLAVGASQSRETTNADESVDARAASGSIDLRKGTGTASASASHADKDGNTASIGGDVTLGQHEAGGHVNASLGTKTVALTGSAGGKLQSELEAPVERDGRWVVRYTKSQAIDASLGARGQGPISASGSVEASLGQSGSGERVFESEAEAQAFYAKGEFGSTELPSTADATLDALPPGASLDEGQSGSVGGGIGGGAGGVGVSFGLQRAVENNLHAERGPGDTIILTLSQSDMLGATAGIGSLLTMQYGESWGTADWQRVEFDLSTASGQEAFEAFTASRQLPETGWKLLGTGHDDLESSSVELDSIGLASGGITGGVSEGTSKDGSGGEVETSRGTEDASASIVGLGSASQTNSLTISDSAAGRAIEAETEVDSSSAQDASRQLASATGTHSTESAGASSGKWDVTTEIPPALAEEFMSAVEADRVHDLAAGGSIAFDQDLLASFREALAAAKGDAKLRRSALAQFVADGGDVALSHLMNFGDAPLEHYVTLEGDDAFLGADGWAGLEHQLADCEARLGDKHADRGKLGVDVESIQQGATSRLAKLRDPKRYTDLPKELRAEELERTNDVLARCEKVVEAAAQKPLRPPRQPGAKVDAAAAAEEAKDAASSTASVAQKRMGSRQQSAYTARDLAERARWVHEEANANLSPRGDLDDGMIFSGAEGSTYKTIDEQLQLGAAAMVYADREQEKGLTPGLPPADKEDHFGRAADWFDAADRHFRAALGYFDMIRVRHPEMGNKWAGHPEPNPPPADNDF